ncbi:MAG: saccharopine dehydrogenase family protein [Anaerolineae bacterium]
MRWMIYGATGYTGQLVVEEAIKRGHRPLLGGRNPQKLAVLASRYDLDYVAFRLNDEAVIAEAIADVDLVYHGAGPFIHTSEPMIRACLATHTHYLDITGEINVFERTYQYDDTARKVGVALISGAGFDVVPSDCLSAYVANEITGATHLETGIIGLAGASAGTTKSALEMMSKGWLARRDGVLVNTSFGDRRTTFTLPDGRKRHAVSAPWGDLAVAYRTTGIPNITSYLAMPSAMVNVGRILYPIGTQLLKLAPVRQLALSMVDRFVDGPDEQTRQESRSYIYAKATNYAGQSASAWLETLEPYQYTAKVGVLAVEQFRERELIGALTPAQAFGVDFTLSVPDTTRQDV